MNGGYKSCLQRGRHFFCKFVYLRPCKDTYKPVLRKRDRAGIGMRRKSFRFRRTDRRIRKDRFVASHLKLYTYVSIIREIIFSRRKKLNMINEKKIKMVKRVDSKSLLRHKLSMKSSLFVGLFQFPRPVQWRIGKKRRIMRW